MRHPAHLVASLVCGVGVVGLAALPSLAPGAHPVGTVALAVASLAGLGVALRGRQASSAPPSSPEVSVAEPPGPPAALVEAPAAPAAEPPSEASLLANLSHEIRTPLNGVVSTVQLLAETSLDEEQLALVHTLETSSTNLLDLINDILDFSKAEAGEITLEHRRFSPAAMAGELTRLYAAQAHNKDLELVCDVDPTLPETLLGDPTRLRQVLSNLLTNAIKFTRRGEVIVAIRRDGDRVWFGVRDTGIGIDRDAQQRIFQSYQQADSATPRMFGGTGLGLAICKQLVELMGGTISVESEVGAGSCFSFSLDAGPLAARALEPLPKGRVLVVEKAAGLRAMIRQTLEARGLEVDTAPDGLEGLQTALHAAQLGRPISTLVVDANLEGVNGPVLARMFRRETELAGVRILILARRNERPKGAELAALDMEPLEKPISASDLVRVLRRSPGAAAMAPQPRPPENPSEPKQAKQSLSTSAPLALAAHVTQSSPDDAAAKGPRVLLVDDNGFNQMLIQMQLKKLGCSVHVAPNGLAGVNAWQAGRFDLVLMDLQMPEMNGFEATVEIRRREASGGLARTPIVAVTADTAPKTRDRCLEVGMDQRLTKPIIVEQLAEVVRSVTPAMEMGA